MAITGNRHVNYEILNLIGYGLAKFSDDFIKQFGFTIKTAFYNFCVEIGVADTVGTVKNRMDLFDPFFPENGRMGWWQKGDAYIHRKVFIDSLFGSEDVKGFANIVKAELRALSPISIPKIRAPKLKPIAKSRFKQLQKTGLQAEMFFLANYNSIEMFEGGLIEDARLFGDGYDFQVDKNKNTFLAEIKGIREKRGKLRLTEKEYKKAEEYKDDYVLTVVSNLNDIPIFKIFRNPAKNLAFEKKDILPRMQIEYHLISAI
ncbi:MAG: DUF3883 domain-containing protein [Blastocatellia bacterium]|nr:DUF3883 domain-containing protein [Blastocatellia bacterium]